MSQRPAKNEGSVFGTPIRVLIADRSAHFRETIRQVLDRHPNCEVAGEAAGLPEAVARIAEARPDLILLDVGLVASPGLTRLRQLARNYPWLCIVVLLTDYLPDYETALHSQGRYFWAAKDRLEEDLACVIGRVKATTQ